MPTGSIERISDTLAIEAGERPFADWTARREMRHLADFDAVIQSLSGSLSRFTCELPSDGAAFDRAVESALAGLGEALGATEAVLFLAPADGATSPLCLDRFSPRIVWTRRGGIRSLPGHASSIEPLNAGGLGPSSAGALRARQVVHTAPFDVQMRSTGWRRSRSKLLIPLPGPTGLLGVIRVEAGPSGSRWSPEHVQKAQLFGQILGGGLGRQRLEEELAELQREQAHGQRLEALGRVASSVAHDFNNLITAILGYADLLEMDIAESGSGDVELAEIREAARRAAGLVEQVLGFGRARDIGAQRVDLAEVVKDLEGMLRQVLGPDIGLDLALSAMDPEGEAPVRVKLDPGRLGPVLLNLASNARGALEGRRGDPRFELRVEPVDVGAEETSPAIVAAVGDIAPGKYVRLTATDNGCGLSREVADRIFEPFFTTKQPGSGTGLGLASAAEFTLHAGGGIRVESRPDEGAAFRLFFPVDALDASDPADAPDFAD